MKKLLGLLLVVGLVGFFATVTPTQPKVNALSDDLNDFTVTNFASDETLTNDDKQGELYIKEKISVDFTADNHGVLRAIPDTYKGHQLHLKVTSVSSDTGAPAQYTTYQSNGNTVLKVGDPNQTVTGSQEYNIDYSLQNVVTFYPDHDELYWNVNGDQWTEPFDSVSVKLHLPDGVLSDSPSAPKCYGGTYGSTNGDCSIYVSGNTVSASTHDLGQNQTLTYVVALDKGYFTPMTTAENIEDWLSVYLKPILEFTVPVLAALIGGFIWWFKSGRDAKGRGTIVPEYDAPTGINPTEAGTIVDFKVDNRDMTAMFIDLARRGYMKIIEVTQNRALLKDKVSYRLQLLQGDNSQLNPQEASLLSSLNSYAVDGAVNLDDLKDKFYVTAKNIRESLTKSLTARGYFRHDPGNYAVGLGTIATIVFVAFWLGGFFSTALHAGALLAGLVVGGVIFMLFVRAMPARTALGVEAKERLEGLKMYMETAEKDRLEKLEGPEAQYANGAGEPERTVELFEKLLPFAIALGVENEWAKKFDGIYKSAPDWYSGNWTAFNVGYFVGSLNSGFAPAVNSSFSAPRSSGGSGFGGGFSGGGGGGGGGGGW